MSAVYWKRYVLTLRRFLQRVEGEGPPIPMRGEASETQLACHDEEQGILLKTLHSGSRRAETVVEGGEAEVNIVTV
jgi:hypothetical protein